MRSLVEFLKPRWVWAGVFLLVACNKEIPMPTTNVAEVKKNLEAIQNYRIFFGHQSVGKNIMAGLQNIASLAGQTGLTVVNIDSNPEPAEGGLFSHSRLGRNEHPETKCEAYANHLIQATPYDAAILKFCFVDVTETRDVDKLLAEYKETVAKIKAARPNTLLIHVTVPLVANSGGWKIPLKRLIGWADYNDPANIRRCEFNEKLLAAFPGEPIFDLAGIESTRPDGMREGWKAKGKQYFSLYHGYTEDGGHLNSGGRDLVASKLVEFLAAQLAGRQPQMIPTQAQP